MIRVLHLSDVHFGPPHLDEQERAILVLARQRRPDLVVVSGDLTQRAKPPQFRQARRFVDGFEAPVIVVPGNHDVPLYRFWERFLDPYGAYRRHFDRELEPLIQTDSVVAVGINTAHGWTIDNGRFRASALRRTERILAESSESAIRIVVAHHNLVAPQRFDRLTIARNSRAAIELFSRIGVDLVLSGHCHQSFVAFSEDYYPQDRSPVLIVHSGTTTSDRGRGCERGQNSCFWLEIGNDATSVSRLRWESSLARFAEHSRLVVPRRHRLPNTLDGTDAETPPSCP